MFVGNKIFSYPVLNHDSTKSTFLNKNFDFTYDQEETSNTLILKNVMFSSNSDLFNRLYAEGKIRVKCIIECSESVFRQTYDVVPDLGHNISLNINDLKEKVIISAYAYATENFSIASDEFLDYYRNVVFEIEKYNIIAIHDGYSFYVRKEEQESNIVHSIFTIVPSHDMSDEDGYDVNFKGKKIEIYLNDKAFANYKQIYATSEFKEIFFGIILVHSLEMAIFSAIKMIKEEEKDIDDVCFTYRWFSSVLYGYKIQTGEELTTEKLKDYSDEKACLLAQKLLGNPINKALQSMVNIMKGNGENKND